ncbi:Protein sgm1 [Tolypocladium ophioglossoides CBS 100239]|uniref:Protein sgm1 n=1 Tax=Tolypocladium ophioglossoides (strain CBS 100239) TaxID=1163406 RepID=A0A0L0N881_TOLOC|nr:Protein sgm1 [Tolypocladium ophioglossoides CBS 100239]
MAAPGKSSRWGSFLSQAVAGVESRLDNILAEADGAAQPQPQDAPPAAPAAANGTKPTQLAPPAKPSPVNSRSSSSNRTNDRLQARLAKAMVAKNAPGGTESRGTPSPRSSVDQASRGSMERPSTDDKDRSELNETPSSDAPEPEPSNAAEAPTEADPETQSNTVNETSTQETSSEEAATSGAAPTNNTRPRPEEPKSPEDQEQEHEAGPGSQRAALSDLAKDMGEIKKWQQEEIQEYVERIDSLQSKLQYLSKSATESARKAASSAPSGSLERKLAEKDEKIALLMEEGQKLSSTEQKFRTTIKKLRIQMTEHEKQVEELKKSRDKSVSDAESLRNRLNGAEGTEKRQDETRKATAALQKEIDALKKEKMKNDEAYRRLEQDMKTKAEQAETASAEALSKALAAEREKQKELEDANAALRADKESLTDKARQENIEWREKLERAVERGRTVEHELKLELRSMESKLEAMRTAAEEASSGSGGEAQVKMFRQIETLQSQYASARENWQGIESSLLAQAANLEKERDEAQRRESEMRKKARDAANRCRHLEDELSDAQPALGTARRELEACRDQLAALKASSQATEEALEQARADIQRKTQRSSSRDDPVEAERRQWVDDVAGATFKGHQSRPESPLPSVSRTFSIDFIGLPVPGKLRRTPTSGSIPDSPADILSPMRRLSSQPPVKPGIASPVGSGPPPTPFSPFEPPPSDPSRIPSPPAAERENGVDDIPPSSPRNLAQDMISVSTVAAGPSVQLVERMSAAIRRLEAEKVAAKEEMTRVCNQRDEARADMVTIMKDLEDAKTASSRVPQLEEQVSNLDARYQTTLEMLGEKSELVEELRADVQDVKVMYRELVERTVK